MIRRRMSSQPTRGIDGIFYRAVFADHAEQLLSGAISPEGRFHHDGQAALYLSSRVDWVAKAIAAYLRPDDPPRVVGAVTVTGARVVDLRRQAHCAAWGIDARDAAVPWLPERGRGDMATSWRVSDAVRAGGADGMIYTARSRPDRWHLVLFRWNGAGGPVLRQVGPLLPFQRPDGSG